MSKHSPPQIPMVQNETSRLLTKRRAFLGGLAAPWFVGLAAHADESAGKVETLRGEAYAQAAAARRALALASEVFVGDFVGTSAQSFLGLRLGAATLVRLGPDAQLRIDRFLVNVGGILELARGGVLCDHDTATSKFDMTVRTPFGLIAVRGTRFFAGPSNGVFGVFVASGAVTVVGDHTSVQVPTGFGTDISRPGAEPTNPTAWGAARIERALASVM